MGDSNDFTFCQVGPKIDEDNLESPKRIPNIGKVTINDDCSIGTSVKNHDPSPRKDNSLEGSQSLQKGNVRADYESLQELNINARKPIVRGKIPFEKGYSQMDWLKITRMHPDLAGLKGQSNRRLISMDEVKQHKTEGSVWTVLKGRVYNISPYMKFHPGGVDMIRKAAGKDCTSLFNKYHAWVNAEFLLEKCMVGILDDSR